jgi:hypothetical protein
MSFISTFSTFLHLPSSSFFLTQDEDDGTKIYIYIYSISIYLPSFICIDIYIYIYTYIHIYIYPRFPAFHPSKSVILKYDLLLIFKKRRFYLDTKSKCQFDNEVHRQKQVILNMT